MKKIFLIIGESGSGKTSVVEKIKKISNLKSIDSYTTRPKRYVEENGHTFITDEEFDSLQNICAYTEFCDYRYAATSKQIDENDIYIIDVDGINYFKENYIGNKEYRIIYLHCSKTERARRMRLRGDSEDAIQNRLSHDDIAFFGATGIANKLIKNTQITRCVNEIINYINKENTVCETEEL